MPGKFGTLIKETFGTRGYNSYRRLSKAARSPGFTGRFWFNSLVGRPQLAELGRYYGTNKVNENLQFNGLSYLDIYEKYLHPLRDEPVSLLEIGVRHGESLKTWKAYFDKGTIHGVDIDPSCKELEEERVRVEIGSQDDAEFMRNCFGEETRFDVIVDDGSHINSFTIASFEALFPSRLKPGGIYIIEDLGCSYKKLQSEQNIREHWFGMKHNDPDKDYDNDRTDLDRFFQAKIRDLDHLQGEIQTLHFWPMCCVILKV